VTRHPTAEWLARQITEANLFDHLVRTGDERQWHTQTERFKPWQTRTCVATLQYTRGG
jgi:hypothetical protein